MKVALLFFVALFATPAFAERCWFVDPEGNRLTFLDNGENELIIQYASGQTETCVDGMSGETGTRTVWCEAESKMSGEISRSGDTVLLFGRQWTNNCP